MHCQADIVTRQEMFNFYASYIVILHKAFCLLTMPSFFSYFYRLFCDEYMSEKLFCKFCIQGTINVTWPIHNTTPFDDIKRGFASSLF